MSSIRWVQDILGKNDTLIRAYFKNVPYEININVSEFITPKIMDGEEYLVCFACFVRDIEIFKTKSDYKKRYPNIPIKRVVPVGTVDFSAKEERNSSDLLLGGTIKSVEKKVNSFTNLAYYHVVLSSDSMDFNLLISDDDGLDLIEGDLAIVDCKAYGRVINKRVGDDFDKGRSKTYDWTSNNDECAFIEEIASFIFDMDELYDEFLVVSFDDQTKIDDISFMQTIKGSDHYLIEVGISDENGITSKIYRLLEKELLSVVQHFYNLCMKATPPDLSLWEDVTEEVFGEG